MNLFVVADMAPARFTKTERGANTVEYILLVALIALAVIAAVVFMRGQLQDKFSDAGSQATPAVAPTRSVRATESAGLRETFLARESPLWGYRWLVWVRQ
jgi:Flp pilus assembly pilin Flp